MTKRNDLERELLMAGSGFCKKLSMKELYAESIVWKKIRDLGNRLTVDWPADIDGKDSWISLHFLNDIRYQCVKALCCKDDKELESIFSRFCLHYNFGVVPIKYIGEVSVKMFLTWVALKYIKKPSRFVRSFIRGLENMFFYNRVKAFSAEKDNLFTQEEMESFRLQVEFIYYNIELLRQRIKEDKEQGIYLKIKPSLANPHKIYENWAKVTNNFDMTRIGETLTLWNKDSERIIILKYMKEDCEEWQTNLEEVRIQKLNFLDELIKSLKKGTSIALLCRLQELNMQNENQLKVLQNNIERMNVDYALKRHEMQEKLTELDIQVKEQDKTIRRQDGYINSLEKGENKKRDIKNYNFQHCITFPEYATYIIRRLHELVDCQTSPKQIVMPLRAAMDAGIIRQPTWGEFCAEFGCDKVRSKTSLSNYFRDYYRFKDEAFNLLVKEFTDHRNRSEYSV